LLFTSNPWDPKALLSPLTIRKPWLFSKHLKGGGTISLGGTPIIRTNQQSLKFMMTQRMTEGIQHKLLMKLLEFNYIIEYKKGVENKVVDALPRKDMSASAISTTTPSWATDVEESYIGDPLYTRMLQ
jgi:hypothetical protein